MVDYANIRCYGRLGHHTLLWQIRPPYVAMADYASTIRQWLVRHYKWRAFTPALTASDKRWGEKAWVHIPTCRRLLHSWESPHSLQDRSSDSGSGTQMPWRGFAALLSGCQEPCEVWCQMSSLSQLACRSSTPDHRHHSGYTGSGTTCMVVERKKEESKRKKEGSKRKKEV